MAIISQDAIKLGCSGGQGKIQIQTFFEHADQLVQQMSRILYKSACFSAKQSQFQKSQMDVSFIITRDYEKKTNRTFDENKPNQSQFQNRSQTTDDRRRTTEDRRKKTEVRKQKTAKSGQNLHPVEQS